MVKAMETKCAANEGKKRCHSAQVLLMGQGWKHINQKCSKWLASFRLAPLESSYAACLGILSTKQLVPHATTLREFWQEPKQRSVVAELQVN